MAKHAVCGYPILCQAIWLADNIHVQQEDHRPKSQPSKTDVVEHNHGLPQIFPAFNSVRNWWMFPLVYQHTKISRMDSLPF